MSMSTLVRSSLILSLVAVFGCVEEKQTSINPTPAEIMKPAAVTPAAEKPETKAEAKSEAKADKPAEPAKAEEAPAKVEEPKKEESAAKPEAEAKPGAEQSCDPAPVEDADGVALEFVKFDEFTKRVVNKDSKLTMVDIWATFCAPCKENFPHVLEMNKKYGPKGLKVISLTIDEPTDTKAVSEARKFLIEKKATITNLIMNEKEDDRYDKLELSVIPAVYIYDPSGKLIKKYTYDDPNDQFTYDQVEKEISDYLDGKPFPTKKAK